MKISAHGPAGRHKRRSVALGLIISAVFLYLTFRKIDAGDVLEALAQVSIPVLLLSLVTRGLGLGTMAWRSRLLLEPLHRFRMFRVFKSVLVGFAGNNVLPMRMGEILRVDYLARFGHIPHSSCLAVVVFERLVDLVCLLLVFACSLPLVVMDMSSVSSMCVVAVGVLGAGGMLVGVSRQPSVFVAVCRRVSSILGTRVSDFVVNKAERFAKGLAAVRSLWTVLAVFLLSLAYWCCMMGSVRIWIAAFGLDLPWYAPLVIIAFIAFGAAIPSAPAFIGTYHYVAAAALMLLGSNETVAVSFALVGHAIAIVPFTLLAVALLFPDFVKGSKTLEPAVADEEIPSPS